MRRPGHTRARQGGRDDWRLILLMFSVILIYLAVGVRMGLMAATEAREPSFAASARSGKPVRGEIVDRHGRLLAANLPAWSLYARPHEIKNPLGVARQLARIFPDESREGLLNRLTSSEPFEWIKRPVSPGQKQAVLELGAPGLFFGAREVRVYPGGRVAGHILGGVKAEREAVSYAELVGSGGVEKHFDAVLRAPDRAGAPVRLSIDVAVQQAMRDVLGAGMRRLTAKGAAGVLMKVGTGEIIAMVSLPDFDPNQRPERFRGLAERNPRFNRAAQGLYELGSTFKVLTAAIALETGVARADTLVETPPVIVYGRHRIRDFHRMPPEMSVSQIVVKSSNVGSARLATMIGTRRFREYLDRLGFLAPTGLELAEAPSARPLLPDNWTDLSTMTISFGHGLASTPVHLAAGFLTIANGGLRGHPSLAYGGRPAGERVFSEATAREVLHMMRETVTDGTATRADVPGFAVAGKTGTAEKVRPGGGYDRKRVISTFASVFPATRPEYVLVVTLDEPTDRSGRRPVRTAGRTAVPVAADVIRRVTPLLGMAPVLPGTVGSETMEAAQ